MAWNVEIGALANIEPNAKRNISQNLISINSSTAWAILKCVFRTPELFVLILDTAMNRCLSLKPLARIGSGGSTKYISIPQIIVSPPAKKYI